MGLLVAGFFGLGIPVSILMLTKARLVLSPAGFTMFNGFKSKLYRWTDVEHFYPARIGRTTQVAWDFAADYDGYGTIGKINVDAVAGAEASLGDNFATSPDELAELMNEWRERYGARGRD